LSFVSPPFYINEALLAHIHAALAPVGAALATFLHDAAATKRRKQS